jgi:hypothetical protein
MFYIVAGLHRRRPRKRGPFSPPSTWEFLGAAGQLSWAACAAAASSPPSARWRTCCAASRPVFPCSTTGSAAA